MTQLRTRPVINLENERAVFEALSDFTRRQPELANFIIFDSCRTPKDNDPDQGYLFEPTSRQDLIAQGLTSGTHFLTFDRATDELDIVPPTLEASVHNRLLNLASSAATLAVYAQ